MEWKDFRSPDFAEIAKRIRENFIFDGRNQYQSKILDTYGLKYYQIGVGTKKVNEQLG